VPVVATGRRAAAILLPVHSATRALFSFRLLGEKQKSIRRLVSPYSL
jgi:hypothetical protein